MYLARLLELKRHMSLNNVRLQSLNLCRRYSASLLRLQELELARDSLIVLHIIYSWSGARA